MPPELQTEDLDSQEIFSTGLWNKDQYSEGDLDGMVEAFGKVGFRPPIKLGHSETQKLLKGEGLPAAGWIENLRRAGNKLVCDFKRVPRKIAELIKAGAYRKKSAEVYWDYLDEAKSTKFPRVLKAVSLLGEEIPAVTSLADIMALYKKLPDGPAHAYEDEGREFRVYCMPEMAMPQQNPLDSYLLQFPRKSKETVNYTDTGEEEEGRCGNCKFYIGYRSACTLVEGWIEQEYVCDYFEARPGMRVMGGNGDVRKYTIEKRGDEWCLIAKSTGKTLGCHDTEEGAMAQERAVQANKHSADGVLVTLEQMKEICPSCAERMEFSNLKAVRIGKYINLPEGTVSALCDKFGESEGFRTRCMASDAANKVDDPGAFCNALKQECFSDKGDARVHTEDTMIKVNMSREDVGKICPPCAERMRERNISALKFSAEQVARFAEMDMEECMAKADMAEKYPDEADRKAACQKMMGEAMMDAVNQAKGGPDMDEKRFQELRAQAKADLEAKEAEIKKDYDAKLADAKKREDEQAAKIKALERQRYDDQNERWIAEQKKAGILLPVEEPRVRAIFSELFEDGRVVKFSQDGKEASETLADAVKTFVAKRPSIFREMSQHTLELGETMDNPGDELDRLAKEDQKKNNVKEYSAAFEAVRKENPELTQKWLALQQ